MHFTVSGSHTSLKLALMGLEFTKAWGWFSKSGDRYSEVDFVFTHGVLTRTALHIIFYGDYTHYNDYMRVLIKDYKITPITVIYSHYTHTVISPMLG